MKKMSFLSLLVAGVMSLSLVAPFSAHAAEAGEVSIGEPPIAYETSIGEPPMIAETSLGEPPLAPAVTMTPEGEIIYSPEEMPEETPDEPVPPTPTEEPIVGGRSERIAYLRSMRYYYVEDGEDRPLWEYVEWLITEGGWDTNGWLWELLEEAFPGESVEPEPIPEEPDEPIPPVQVEEPVVGGRSERIGYLKALRLMEFGEDRSLEDFASWLVADMNWDEDYLWDLLYEAYPEESQTTSRWLAENRCGLEDFTVEYIEEEVEANEPETSGTETGESTENVEPEYPAYSILGDPGMEYAVARGDSLWKISEKLYGDGNYWFIIAGANADKMSNPSRIYAGQVLFIPTVAFAHRANEKTRLGLLLDL